jgi:hypothetical protein
MVYDQVLVEICRMLANVVVTYPVPNRISLGVTQSLIQQFLSSNLVENRLRPSLTTALFRVIGIRFGL